MEEGSRQEMSRRGTHMCHESQELDINEICAEYSKSVLDLIINVPSSQLTLHEACKLVQAAWSTTVRRILHSVFTALP